jgi:hypothetical protein
MILSNFKPSPSWGVDVIHIPAAWEVEEPKNEDIWGIHLHVHIFFTLLTFFTFFIVAFLGFTNY